RGRRDAERWGHSEGPGGELAVHGGRASRRHAHAEGAHARAGGPGLHGRRSTRGADRRSEHPQRGQAAGRHRAAQHEPAPGANRARTIADDLAALTQSFGSGTSRNSVAVVRAGMLASNGLLNDARRVVLDALASDPDEPALHQALGSLYQKSGLGEMAAESFDEAQSLL